MGKHCELVHIIDPQATIIPSPTINGKTLFIFDFEVSPNTKSNELEPGTYQVKLIIAASNFKPVTHTFEIYHTGNWHPNEDKMFSDGIGIKEI